MPNIQTKSFMDQSIMNTVKSHLELSELYDTQQHIMSPNVLENLSRRTGEDQNANSEQIAEEFESEAVSIDLS